jgi:hypothetical protein
MSKGKIHINQGLSIIIILEPRVVLLGTAICNKLFPAPAIHFLFEVDALMIETLLFVDKASN